MKKHIRLLILLIVLILMLSACSKTATDVPTTTEASQETASSSNETSTNSTAQEVSNEETSGETDPTMTETKEPTQTEAISTTSIVTDTQTTTTATKVPVTEEQNANTLKITGKVTYEMTITLDELKSLDDIIVEEDYYSVNTFGTKGHTRFKGANLWYLLDQYAGIKEDASSITVLATDGYKVKFTIEQIMKQDYIDETDPNKKLPVIVAWEENGVAYDPEDGAPYKLAVGQIAPGDLNKPQWVSMIDSIIIE